MLTAPSGTKFGTRPVSAPLQWSPWLVQVWHVTYFQRSGLFILKIIVSVTTAASSAFNAISAIACMWQLDQKSVKYSWPNHMTSLYKVFTAFLVASDQPSYPCYASFRWLQPIRWRFAQEWPHLSRKFSEQGREVLEMGLAGPRQRALLVGRRRRCFPAEGVKEQAGGLVVGGNLFLQHSCLQRACLFTPWTNHSDNQQWKPGCGEIHGNFAQTFPLSCYTHGSNVFLPVRGTFPSNNEIHADVLAHTHQASKYPHSSSAIKEGQRCHRV